MKSMLRNFILVSFFASSTILSFAQKAITPLDLNNRLADITDTLYKYGSDWGKQVGIAMSKKDFTVLAPYRKKAEQYADKKFLEVTTMKDISGSENLRAAMLEFLAYEKLLIKEHFYEFEKLAKTATNDDVQKLIQKLVTASEKEGAALKKVNDAQTEYAKKNGFTIDEADTAEKEGGK